MVRVKLINESNNVPPRYETKGSSGVDVKSKLEKDVLIKPMERVAIPTGLFLQIPKGYEIQIRPRSGLSLKTGLVAILGTIDSDYRGEIKIILSNLSSKDIIIRDGDRVAQMVLAKVEEIDWEIINTLENSERGEKGFGSTGVN